MVIITFSLLGGGKSTCIQLMQRFYDPEQGRINIGLDEISSDVTLKDLRSKMSIVSQEPTLFDRTIAENIAYGDNSRTMTLEEIIGAAKTANAHNFIVQLPQVQLILTFQFQLFLKKHFFQRDMQRMLEAKEVNYQVARNKGSP